MRPFSTIERVYVKFYKLTLAREVGDSEDEKMKQQALRTDHRSPLGSVHGVECCVDGKVSWGIAILVCFTMSSRFSAHDYDDRPLSSTRSFIDLSPSSHTHPSSRPRARPSSVSSLGREDRAITIPTKHTDDDGERSSIRIDTDFTVRIKYTTRQKNIPSLASFAYRRRHHFPSLALTREIALAD